MPRFGVVPKGIRRWSSWYEGSVFRRVLTVVAAPLKRCSSVWSWL
jgi:hypothetical protein